MKVASLLAVILLGANATGHAQNPDTSDILIRAERATLNQHAGTGLYEGNAELLQGIRQLRADSIRIELKDGAPQRIEATGGVMLKEEGIVEARGNRLVYDVASQRISVYEQAYVNHQGRVFEGAELEYDLQSKQVDARGGGEDGRVRLVIPAEELE
ncbi:MAG: lipopolysaccharide transport periplasmic protein LptA [Alcanivoracaceae bacterium]|nr:lipopolysaccharide transport periplasmic protein LptA [Alcanivoracaceae bacterium]